MCYQKKSIVIVMLICICRISWFNVTNLSHCVPATQQSNSLTNESTTLPPRPSSPKPSVLKSKIGTPPRRSMAPHALATGRYFPKYYIDGDSNWMVLAKSIVDIYCPILPVHCPTNNLNVSLSCFLPDSNSATGIWDITAREKCFAVHFLRWTLLSTRFWYFSH